MSFGSPGSPGIDFTSVSEVEAYPGSTRNDIMSSGSPDSLATNSFSAGEKDVTLAST